jgi:serine/threonine protein kinase
MRSCLSDEELQQYFDSAMDAAAHKAAESHLADCDACVDRAARFAGAAVGRSATVTHQHTAHPLRGSVDVNIPGFQILRELKRGGQGVVYQAVQLSTQRKVAVKVLLDGPHASPSAIRRFEREIQLIAQMRHPNIVAIFDSGLTAEGRNYYVMDYVRGETLSAYIQRVRPGIESTLQLFTTVVDAVEHAHQRGVVHRDLKPSNVLIDADGQPFLLDFGLAKWLAAPVEAAISVSHHVVGTLPYMSPEQTRGNPDEVDARTDIYALGVMLYEALTGNYPYPVLGTMAEVLKHIAETAPTPLSRSWKSGQGVSRTEVCPIDADLQTLILKTLSKERERRYQSAGDLAGDIGHYLRGEPITARADSGWYVLKTGIRHRIRKNPGLARVAVIVAAVAVANWPIRTVTEDWTQWGEQAQRLLFEMSAGSGAAFDHVCVVGYQSLDDVISRATLPPGVNRETLGAARCGFGALLSRLAEVAPAAVVLAVPLPSESPCDPAFLEGVKSLREVNVDVVVAVAKWTVDSEGWPEMSHNIAQEVRAGCAAGVVDAMPWTMQVSMNRGARVDLNSLGVAAVAATRHPGWSVEARPDRALRGLDLAFWQARDGRRRWHTESSHLWVSGFVDLDGDAAEDLGLANSDVAGLLILDVPPDGVLANATWDVGDVFESPEDVLSESFTDKVIVIGNVSPKSCLPYDDRQVSLTHGQAVTVETLLNWTAAAPGTDLWLLIGAAVLGTITGQWPRRIFAQVIVALCCVAVTCVGLFVLARFYHHLGNPILPGMSSLIALLGAALVSRILTAKQVGFRRI